MGNKITTAYLEELVHTKNRILLLQGPVSSFFHDFSQWLSVQHHKTVFKINFNYGDEFFYPENTKNTFAYRDTYQEFAAFLSRFIDTHNIQAVMCFGDNRPYHIVAKEIAKQKDLSFWVFEEGYFRPFYITLEKSGVNNFSPLPRSADFYRQALPKLRVRQYQAPPAVKGGFIPMAKCAALYYFAARKNRDKYPHYIHHRNSSLRYYIKSWAISGLKRANYIFEDRKFAQQVANGKYGKFFILPLQVMNDSQVKVHSDFSSVRSFLEHVLSSFATHAPEDTNLIVKHHPMDRGFIDYRKDINRFIKAHPKLKGRVFYVHDTPLPVFLRYGIGMVTLNSTSGLSALIHDMPVKVIGRANYDIAGITAQNSLAEFWNHPIPPDKELFHAFRMYHINVTQINGSFYSKVHLPAAHSIYKPLHEQKPLPKKLKNWRTSENCF
ncbi:capsule biosynthesis protein [Neisseria weaveri]|uniref:capsule biosynthesis protein n=1 Tax=Neisseria weaveri TaxID=28091 RepID=UPI000D314ADB|nr:capsule biosynthesis protein [Neisseria weaveri]